LFLEYFNYFDLCKRKRTEDEKSQSFFLNILE
jgi:hypothetical protein